MSSIKCPHCGKEIPEDLIAGAIENAQTTESVDDAPATNEIAVKECDEGSPATEQETSFVVPLISDAPSESEAADEYDADDADDDEEYLNIIKDCAIINVLAVLLFVGGIASLLLINEWLAAVMFLVAEIFVLVPNEKLMKLCKAKNTSADKKTRNKIVKETRKRVKAKNNNFKFSFVIAYICLACLIISFIIPVPLMKQKQIATGTSSYTAGVEETTTPTAEPLCYLPTIDEFMEDFAAMHKVLLVNDVTYSINQGVESEGDFASYSIRVSTNGIEYMTMSCLTFEGGVYSVSSDISNEDAICEIWGSRPSDDATEFVGFAENILAVYVLLNYQNPVEYSCDTDAFGDFVMLMTNAVKYGEGSTIYKHCQREYEHCSISLGYSATTGSYEGYFSLDIYDRFNDS